MLTYTERCKYLFLWWLSFCHLHLAFNIWPASQRPGHALKNQRNKDDNIFSLSGWQHFFSWVYTDLTIMSVQRLGLILDMNSSFALMELPHSIIWYCLYFFFWYLLPWISLDIKKDKMKDKIKNVHWIFKLSWCWSYGKIVNIF